MVRQLRAHVESGKDFNNQKLNELKDNADKERASYIKRIEEDAATIKKLNDEAYGLNNEIQRLV
jgi:hypothetical protein